MLNRINYRGLLPLSATRRGVSVCALTVIASLAFSTPALAQSTQAAHNQGMSLGTSELNRVGTSNITQQNAQELVPFYKENPVQKNDTRTDANFFFETGVNQINASRGYSSGGCDREGFDPQAEARKGIGEEKWAQMTAEQRTEAIQSQVAFFDQECEGINFLAGEYSNRVIVEIQPGDDLSQWTPPDGIPDVGDDCRIETIYTPDVFDSFYCNESSSIEKRRCNDVANVTVTYEDGLPEEPYTHTIYNHNSPTWVLTTYPADGVVNVYAPLAHRADYPRQPRCLTWNEDRSLCLAANPETDFSLIVSDVPPPYSVNLFGNILCRTTYSKWHTDPMTYSQIETKFCVDEWLGQIKPGPREETISIYGGQTSMTQTFRPGEIFVVRARQHNACVFSFDNFHLRGGSGAPDVHMTWTYNFCVPIKTVNVDWNSNCGQLELAEKR